MERPPREHTLTFPDFFDAMDGLRFLVEHGYRELKGSLEQLVPRSARIVSGMAFGLRRGDVCTLLEGPTPPDGQELETKNFFACRHTTTLLQSYEIESAPTEERAPMCVLCEGSGGSG